MLIFQWFQNLNHNILETFITYFKIKKTKKKNVDIFKDNFKRKTSYGYYSAVSSFSRIADCIKKDLKINLHLTIL